MRFQVEQDVLMKRGDLDSAVRSWAEEFDIDPVVAFNAITEAREREEASLLQLTSTANLTEEQVKKLRAEYSKFQTAEARRDDIWTMAENNEFNWNKQSDVNEFNALMMLANNSSGAFSFEEDDGGALGNIFEWGGNIVGNIADNVITNQLKKWGLPLT